MSNKRYASMFFRLGLLASVIFAAFWGVWQLTGHQVPMNTSLKFSEITILTIPFSRWWDVPFAFLMVNLYAWNAWVIRIYYNKFSVKFYQENLEENIVILLFGGLVTEFFTGLATSLAVGIISGLAVGIISGLVVSLIFFIASGFVSSSFIVFYFLVKILFSSNFWKSIYNWLTAKDIN